MQALAERELLCGRNGREELVCDGKGEGRLREVVRKVVVVAVSVAGGGGRVRGKGRGGGCVRDGRERSGASLTRSSWGRIIVRLHCQGGRGRSTPDPKDQLHPVDFEVEFGIAPAGREGAEGEGRIGYEG